MLYNTEAEINDVLLTTFDHVSLPGFAESVTWKWNDRFTTTLGRSHYDERQIELSSPLWKQALPQDRIQTVIHEACHLAADELFGHQDHGPPWRHLMLLCGTFPSERHCVNYDENRIQVHCACDGGCRIGKIRYSRIMKGEATYSCGRCRQRIRITQ